MKYKGFIFIVCFLVCVLSFGKNMFFTKDYIKLGTYIIYFNNNTNHLQNDLSAGKKARLLPSYYDWDINMLISYGQSLSVGGTATDKKSNFRRTLSFQGGCNEWASNVNLNDTASIASFYGSDFVLLASLSNKSWPPVAAAAISWMSLLENENMVDLSTFEYQFILSTPGYSGAPIELFIKGTPYYQRLLFGVKKAYEFSRHAGKSFGVPCLFWVQGEANITDSKEQYYDKLKQLFIDLNTDIKTISGQTKDVIFITYQMSPVIGNIPYPSYENPTFYSDCGPSFAQLQLAQDMENVYLGGAMYQYQYFDIWHPVDRAVVGLQAGIVAKRIINDRKPLTLFFPKKYSIEHNCSTWSLNIEFDIPIPPMRFDISGDEWHNPNGKQINYGFKLENVTGLNIIAAEPTIKNGNTLVIKCIENPTNARLSYAINGHYGGGNLCDSQNIKVDNKNTVYIIDNFCPAFRDYIIY